MNCAVCYARLFVAGGGLFGELVDAAMDIGIGAWVEVAQRVDHRPAASDEWRRYREKTADFPGAPPGSESGNLRE